MIPRSAAKTLIPAIVLAVSPAVSAVESLKVVGLFTNKAIVEIDGKRRVLTAGQDNRYGVKLISADSEAAVIEIDGKRKRYPLGTHSAIGTNYSEPGARAMVRIFPDTTGMYTVNGSIEGFPVRFLVDTGATLIAINRNEAKRIGLDYKLDGRIGQAVTASGTVKAYYLTLDRVKVGDIELRDVPATVLDGDHPQLALLGNSFLGRLDIQREGQIMELRLK